MPDQMGWTRPWENWEQPPCQGPDAPLAVPCWGAMHRTGLKKNRTILCRERPLWQGLRAQFPGGSEGAVKPC